MSDDLSSVLDMLEASKDAVGFTEGMDLDTYLSDTIRQLAVERLLEIVGEAARRITEEFKEAHPEIPWAAAIGLRNVISHQYDAINRQRVWEIVTGDLPSLISKLEPLVPKEEE